MNENNFINKFLNFYNKNKTTLLYFIVGVIALVALIYYVFQYFLPEREEEANSAMCMAEFEFEKGNYDLALKGNNNFKGFEYIKNNFSFTKANNLAKYYSGLCFLNLGKYDDAINSLKEFSTEENDFQALSYFAMAGAYSEKNNVEQALEYYKKASETTSNPILSPKLMLTCAKAQLHNKKTENTLEIFDKIENDFPNSQEAQISKMLRQTIEK